jgi:hypothetical protein
MKGLKVLETIEKLARIESMIRDRNFIATQPAIAVELGCSERQVRTYFDVLDFLGARLINHGRMGWELMGGWTLGDALGEYCKTTQEKRSNNRCLRN